MSRREHPRVVGLLREQYRAAERAGDWPLCVALAEQMQGLDRSKSVGAEVQYALGFAHEKLGDLHRARGCYTMALVIDSRCLKAQRALARIDRDIGSDR